MMPLRYTALLPSEAMSDSLCVASRAAPSLRGHRCPDMRAAL